MEPLVLIKPVKAKKKTLARAKMISDRDIKAAYVDQDVDAEGRNQAAERIEYFAPVVAVAPTLQQ